MKKFLVGLSVGFSLLGIVGVASATLITNGSFESGTFVDNGNPTDDTMTLGVGSTAITGWTIINDDVAWIRPGSPWNLTASDGDKFLDFTDFPVGAPFGGVTQTISTTVGQSYVLSFDLGSSSQWGLPSAISASADSTSMVFTSVSPGLDIWQNFFMPFTASTSNTLISLTGTTGQIYIGLDNVSVSAASVPEPSIFILMGFGLIGLVSFNCRRKKQTTSTFCASRLAG